MADLIITERSDIVAIANAVRNKTGDTKELTLNGIVNGINGIDIATEPVLQNKTVTPKTSSQTVKADSGYDGLNQVTVNAMPTATQATPAITVNASGLITATATQTAGYVSAGTKTSTHQLAFQPAKTITPSTASQIAVSSGYYTGGNITVAAVPTQSKTVTPTSSTQNITPDSGKFLSKVTVNGDSDLVAGNIKSGVNIFGVTGTYVGSGGGNTSVEDALVNRTIFSYTNNRITSISAYAFQNCGSLTYVNFPNVNTIGSWAFQYCYSLSTINFPKVTDIYAEAFKRCNSLSFVNFSLVSVIAGRAFQSCHNLTSVSFPKAERIVQSAFEYCSKLSFLSFPMVSEIQSYAFYKCSILSKIYLKKSSVCALTNSNAFYSTKITSTTGSIFVPSSLVASYKKATNWTYFSSRFVGI